MMHFIKQFGKRVLCAVFAWQVRRLRKQHDFKVVAVAGSIGKTSTKRAIATVVGAQRRVRTQSGNYNVDITVPLVFFGHDEPAIFNVLAWARIFISNERQLRAAYPFDVVVIELGTDGPGQMAQFAYLRPDITVVTAIADEHMEYFKTISAVAAEELSVTAYSKVVLANADAIDQKYVAAYSMKRYGHAAGNDYVITERQNKGLQGQGVVVAWGDQSQRLEVAILGKQGASITTAALAVAVELGLDTAAAARAVATVQPVSGRLQLLAGKRGSTLIDDTYNASPVAVTAALDVLYETEADQRIAILGDMNELGDTSAKSHELIGRYCDASKLDYVVTIGKQSQEYLAPEAQGAGCVVKTFLSPYEAGDFVASVVQPKAVVLAKGSQNGVFAEEALKALLENQTDADKLVRQSAYWLSRKQRQFSGS